MVRKSFRGLHTLTPIVVICLVLLFFRATTSASVWVHDGMGDFYPGWSDGNLVVSEEGGGCVLAPARWSLPLEPCSGSGLPSHCAAKYTLQYSNQEPANPQAECFSGTGSVWKVSLPEDGESTAAFFASSLNPYSAHSAWTWRDDGPRHSLQAVGYHQGCLVGLSQNPGNGSRSLWFAAEGGNRPLLWRQGASLKRGLIDLHKAIHSSAGNLWMISARKGQWGARCLNEAGRPLSAWLPLNFNGNIEQLRGSGIVRGLLLGYFETNRGYLLAAINLHETARGWHTINLYPEPLAADYLMITDRNVRLMGNRGGSCDSILVGTKTVHSVDHGTYTNGFELPRPQKVQFIRWETEPAGSGGWTLSWRAAPFSHSLTPIGGWSLPSKARIQPVRTQTDLVQYRLQWNGTGFPPGHRVTKVWIETKEEKAEGWLLAQGAGHSLGKTRPAENPENGKHETEETEWNGPERPETENTLPDESAGAKKPPEPRRVKRSKNPPHNNLNPADHPNPSPKAASSPVNDQPEEEQPDSHTPKEQGKPHGPVDNEDPDNEPSPRNSSEPEKQKKSPKIGRSQEPKNNQRPSPDNEVPKEESSNKNQKHQNPGKPRSSAGSSSSPTEKGRDNLQPSEDSRAAAPSKDNPSKPGIPAGNSSPKPSGNPATQPSSPKGSGKPSAPGNPMGTAVAASPKPRRSGKQNSGPKPDLPTEGASARKSGERKPTGKGKAPENAGESSKTIEQEPRLARLKPAQSEPETLKKFSSPEPLNNSLSTTPCSPTDSTDNSDPRNGLEKSAYSQIQSCPDPSLTLPFARGGEWLSLSLTSPDASGPIRDQREFQSSHFPNNKHAHIQSPRLNKTKTRRLPTENISFSDNASDRKTTSPKYPSSRLGKRKSLFARNLNVSVISLATANGSGGSNALKSTAESRKPLDTLFDPNLFTLSGDSSLLVGGLPWIFVALLALLVLLSMRNWKRKKNRFGSLLAEAVQRQDKRSLEKKIASENRRAAKPSREWSTTALVPQEDQGDYHQIDIVVGRQSTKNISSVNTSVAVRPPAAPEQAACRLLTALPQKGQEQQLLRVGRFLYVFSRGQAVQGYRLERTAESEGGWLPPLGLLPSSGPGFSVANCGKNIYFVPGMQRDSATPIYKCRCRDDGSLTSWEKIGEIPVGLSRHGLAVQKGRLVIAGGASQGKPVRWVFNCHLDGYGRIRSLERGLPLPESIASARCLLAGNRLLVFYGSPSTTNSPTSGSIWCSALSQKGAMSAWKEKGTLPNRGGAEAVFFRKRKVLLIQKGRLFSCPWNPLEPLEDWEKVSTRIPQNRCVLTLTDGALVVASKPENKSITTSGSLLLYEFAG